MATIRTFIAIELTEEAQTKLANMQNRLEALMPPRTVRWTASQNIHLTLHFLGNIALEDVAKISQVIQTIAAANAPFRLTLETLGCFPHLRRPRIIWVGVGGALKPLREIHRQLGQSLHETVGFKPETRPYTPHLTVGRVKKGIPSGQLKQLGNLIEAEQNIGRLVSLPVNEISLMKSELTPTGPVYTKLNQGDLSS